MCNPLFLYLDIYHPQGRRREDTRIASMKSDMMLAVLQLAAERDLPQSMVISVIEDAISAAHKREAGEQGHDVSAKIDANTGEVTINTIVHAVDWVDEEGPAGQLLVDEARKLNPNAEVGDQLITGELEFKPQRIASRATSQYLKQRLRNAERQIVFEQFADKEGELISAPIRRVESPRDDDGFSERGNVIVDLGKADAVLPEAEQSPSERYRPGMELKFYVLRVSNPSDEEEDRPEIVVSRSHPNLLRRLMENEVPEIKSGMVEVREIAREPGARSKIAVYSNRRDVDPIGACVGLRGIRVQNVVTELMGEKIDILEWSDDIGTFITNALSPASVDQVTVLDNDSVEVVVPDSALPLAIGREGQNVALAVRLTNTDIDIKGASEYAEEQLILRQQIEAAAAEARAAAEAKAAAEAERARQLEQEVAEAVADLTEVEEEVAEPVAEVSEDDGAVAVVEEESDEADEAPEVEVVEVPRVPTTPMIFMPSGPLAQIPSQQDAEEAAEDEADLDLELEELEEKLRELEVEEQERQEAAREAQERADLDQFINSDEIWAVPGEFDAEDADSSSGLKFAEDIAGFRDSDADRAARRGRRSSGRGGRR